MLMRLVAAGTRRPAWVEAGFADYAGRLRGAYRLELWAFALTSCGEFPTMCGRDDLVEVNCDTSQTEDDTFGHMATEVTTI